jgi:hypothetical protein
MSGSIRSRQKHKLEPISIEELAGTTGMSGFCSFLTRDSSIPVPALDRAEEADLSTPSRESSAPVPGAAERHAPDPHAAAASAPVLSAPESGASESSAPEPIRAATQEPAMETDAPEPSALETGAGDFGAVESSALGLFPRRRVRLREAVTVQDGHSLAEQAVYDAMYRAGKPYQGDSRVLTIGLRTLAELSRMAYSNCKANVRALVSKLALDELPGFSYTEGRTYIVYSFREILRRRKAAGLTHVVRTRGVAFVDPKTGRELLDSSALQSGAPDTRARDSQASAPERDGAGAPGQRESSAPEPAPYIRKRNLISNREEKSSSGLAAIVAALRRYVPDVDDDIAADLWRKCRDNAPEARIDEILRVIHLKAGKPGIRVPLGFLLTAVPKCFKGDSYRQFREERERSREASLERDRLFAAEILRSPEADDEQKQWAKEILGGQ